MNFDSRSVIYENPLGSFTCRKAGTWDIFYFPSEGRHTEDFPDARKIRRLRPGLNPRTQVPVASMLTTSPPKPSPMKVTLVTIYETKWYNIPVYDSLKFPAQISYNGNRFPTTHVYGYFIRQEFFIFFSSFTLRDTRILLASCDK